MLILMIISVFCDINQNEVQNLVQPFLQKLLVANSKFMFGIKPFLPGDVKAFRFLQTA